MYGFEFTTNYRYQEIWEGVGTDYREHVAQCPDLVGRPEQANKTRKGVPVKSDEQAESEMWNKKRGRRQGRTGRCLASRLQGSGKRSFSDRAGDQEAWPWL